MWLKRKLRKNSRVAECITISVLSTCLLVIAIYYVQPKIDEFNRKSEVNTAQKHHLREIVKLNKKKEELSLQMDEYDDV